MGAGNSKARLRGLDRAARAAFGVALALAAPGAVEGAPVGGAFATRCAMCHQPDAVGQPGQYPRLAGRIGTIASKPEGRRYLALVLVNGMYGKIDVDGRTISGLMPAASGATDKDLADILNALVRQKPPAKKVAPFTPAEIAAVRAEGRKTTAEVAAERARLVASGVVS